MCKKAIPTIAFSQSMRVSWVDGGPACLTSVSIQSQRTASYTHLRAPTHTYYEPDIYIYIPFWSCFKKMAFHFFIYFPTSNCSRNLRAHLVRMFPCGPLCAPLSPSVPLSIPDSPPRPSVSICPPLPPALPLSPTCAPCPPDQANFGIYL